jgi:hypothetical protein
MRAARSTSIGLLLLPLLAGAVGAQAPDGRCDLQFPNTPQSRLTSSKLPSGGYNSYIGGGVVAVCAGQNITLRSDSAEYYDNVGVLYLLGNVHYEEPRAKVDSRRMTYYRVDERIFAEGDVFAQLPNGTTMRGPNAEYFRQTATRPRARMIATGRPHIVLVQTDSAGRKQDPADVYADRVQLEGDSLVYASGRVELTRPDVVARGDSAVMDGGQEWSRLMKSPSIEGKGDRPFTLSGGVIDLYSRQRQLERVVSKVSAHAVSRDLDLQADTIDLRLSAQRLERAFAWGAKRAHAVSSAADIVADSLDVIMPNQRLREVRAIRDAFAQSVPDTMTIRSGERDWLSGDTIVALFDTLVVGDTATRPQIRELVANGNARSYYQIATAGKPTQPAINYVRGRIITVSFANQKVQTVLVNEKAAGLYLEPATDTTSARTRRNATTGARPAVRRPGERP